MYTNVQYRKKEQVTQSGPFRQKKYFETPLKAERPKTIKSMEIQEDNCLENIRLNHMKLLILDSF